MKLEFGKGLILGGATIVAVSCAGTRQQTSSTADSVTRAIANEHSVGTESTVQQRDDLLVLTPSAQNIPEAEIAVAVDGLAISRAEYRSGLRQFIDENPGLAYPEAAYRARLREELLILAYVRDELVMEEGFRNRARAELRETICALVLERIIDSRIRVTDEEIQSRYELDRGQWIHQPRVIVELILVATNAEAQALIDRIHAGENFADLARVFSLHSSNLRGGRMEPFRRGTYSAALEDVAFRLRPGEIGTAETERGIFILRKIADSSETAIPLADVRDQIVELLQAERRAAERAAFMAELESRYPALPAPSPATDQ